MEPRSVKIKDVKESGLKEKISLSILSTTILEDHQQILQYLHLGTNIPVIQEFYKYIVPMLESFHAKALLLKQQLNHDRFEDKTDEVIGITLLYDDGKDTLFFGFFGIFDHEETKITFFVDKLIEYARKYEYTYIRGPVNIPAIIYGWGFMIEGSNKSLFIGCPVNPSIYQRIFMEKGFYIKFEEDRYHVTTVKMNPSKLKKKDGTFYDFSQYEYVNPTKEDLPKLREKMLELHVNYMPPSAQITPDNPTNFDVHMDFIHHYGSKEYVWNVYYKPTGEMIAWGFVVPNPFSKDNRGRNNAASLHYWVVHPDHRRSGLAMFMYGNTSLSLYPAGIRIGSWPVGADNEANAAAAKKMFGKKDRTHVILEKKI